MSTEIAEVHQSLHRGEAVVIATILNSRGSTPRTAGAKMIVYGDGSISGSIGGGAIEGDVIARALASFKSEKPSIAVYDLTKNGNSDELDLICGGRMEVLLEFVNSQQGSETLYETAYRKISRDQPFLWKAIIRELEHGIELERSIEEITGTDAGTFPQPTVQQSADGLVLIEPVLPGQTAYIVGGGHVSREIAKLTKQIGLKTLVFDDRAEFANASRFPQADGIYLCPGYENIFNDFEITTNSYIIIVTRGHSFDKEVLGQALKTGAGYIGMMGSRRKRNTIYDTLVAEGYDASTLENVRCPIGLPIKAETPAELAVSIVAELIDHRASSMVNG